MKYFLQLFLFFTFYTFIISQTLTIEEYEGSVKFAPETKKRPYNYNFWPVLIPSPNIEISLLEDFESHLDWQIVIKRAIEANVRFIGNNPTNDSHVFSTATSDDVVSKFSLDLEHLQKSKEIFNPAYTLAPQTWSMELQCFFKKPGDDFIIIQPNKSTLNNFIIKNVPIAFTVWVRSNNKQHQLLALFKDAKGKQHEINMGLLNFNGWKQMSQFISPILRKRSTINNRKHELTFIGLKIQSNKHEQAGLFLVVFDLLMVATDHRFEKYSGSEILDNF